MKRNLSIFVKINTFGVVPIFIIIIFIIGVGFYSMTNTSFTFSNTPLEKGSYVGHMRLFYKDFPPIMGILGGGYYLHNITLPIIRNAKNPQNNARDVKIGYFFVFLSYVICGTLGYFGFVGTRFVDALEINKGIS